MADYSVSLTLKMQLCIIVAHCCISNIMLCYVSMVLAFIQETNLNFRVSDRLEI